MYSLSVTFIIFKKDFTYFLETGGEGEREGEKHQPAPSHVPQPGTWPTTQACALTRNRTGDLLVWGNNTPHPSSELCALPKASCSVPEQSLAPSRGSATVLQDLQVSRGHQVVSERVVPPSCSLSRTAGPTGSMSSRTQQCCVTALGHSPVDTHPPPPPTGCFAPEQITSPELGWVATPLLQLLAPTGREAQHPPACISPESGTNWAPSGLAYLS